MPTLYDIKTSIPCFIHVSAVSMNDMRALDYYIMNQVVITFLTGDTSIIPGFSGYTKVQPSLYAELKTTFSSKEFIQTKSIRSMAFCSIRSESLLDLRTVWSH